MAAIVLFCLALLVCIVLRTNILYALLAGLVIFTLYGKKQGFSWKELGKMICSGVKTSASVLLVFPLIGILTAFWRACGTLPFIICCAVDLIRPEILLLMTFLLNCGVSMLTGTAFGTAATMGTICVSVGISMGMDPVLLGGAMLSGVYFGDRCSPVSTSALLVSELTETNIYDNIKRMLKTALVPFLLSCGVYAALGMVKSGSGAAGELWSLYGREMTLHWVMCLPAVLILILSVLRVNVKKAMSVSILAAVVLCIFLRHLDAVTILKTAILGYTASDAEVGAMLNGGGIISMVRVALIVMISSAYSGIFRKTGLLDGLCGRVTALRDKTSPYASMLLTAVLASLLACNQTLTIILTHQLCAPSQKDKEEFAINLENSAVVVAPVPLLFLLLSALVLVPSYPYYVTFFYNALGIFLMLQAARENRDVYYMALLPVTKRDVVRARFSTVVTLQLLQIAACIPFMLLRRGYAQINNPVGIEANLAFLGFGFVLMGLFNLTFLPMHYKNGYDLGKPFVVSSVVLFLAIVLLETLDHVVPYMKTVCESYAPADLVRQLPVLLGGVAVYALVTYLAFRTSAARFEQVDL